MYGLGDEGYGCVFIKENFRKYERSSGTEKGAKSVAKVALQACFNDDGFVWKLGGYTSITGGYVSTNQNGRKKLPCTVCALKFSDRDGMKDAF